MWEFQHDEVVEAPPQADPDVRIPISRAIARAALGKSPEIAKLT
jgi:hypothetical protein